MSNDNEALTIAVLGLTKAVERLCDLLETQIREGAKPRQVEWHDTFHDETPLSLMRGWEDLPARHRNALQNAGIVTFGDLRTRDNLRIVNFGKTGLSRLKEIFRQNGVVQEYFPALSKGY